jgi:hypothetical protein
LFEFQFQVNVRAQQQALEFLELIDDLLLLGSPDQPQRCERMRR